MHSMMHLSLAAIPKILADHTRAVAIAVVPCQLAKVETL